ncbi:MAG: O-antigen ligase family protein [Candidatus Accumulibacter sp.]|uniref:O-antigen ligase family protein n=1 Tax=Accumulibacter sp. TaxID=2053492 RepID=UPI001ACB611A|nr:O-antigen ligase family protein [Accumulibacter sp.]MBN8438402.1 O-antigen ligase family protein [Accumulibacter sp.]
MINSESRLAGFVPAIVVDVALAALSFFVLYNGVTSFERSISLYDATLTSQILPVVLLMFLPYVFIGLRPLDFWADQGAWLAIVLVMVVSTALADQSAATDKLRLMIACLAFGLALRTWLEHATDHAVAAILLAICLFHALVLILVIQKAPSANPLLPYDQSWVPYHSHIRHVAYHGMVAGCAGIALGFLHPVLRLPGFLLATLALAGTFFFGARGALLGWLVFVAVFALTSRKYRTLLPAAGLTVALGMGLAMALEAFFIQSPFTGTLHGRVESVSKLVNSTGRSGIWLDALQVALKHPWFGDGMDVYRSSGCCMPESTVHPHNTLVQWLMEFGVIGTFAVLWALWRIIGKRLVPALRHGNTNVGQSVLLSLIVGLLVFGLVDGVFYHAVPLLVFSILCALLYGTEREPSVKMSNNEAHLPAGK